MEYVSHLIGQVPDKLSQLSDDISNVLSFASTIGEQTEGIFLGVQGLQRKSKGLQNSSVNRILY